MVFPNKKGQKARIVLYTLPAAQDLCAAAKTIE
jgi:hypothetical protein